MAALKFDLILKGFVGSDNFSAYKVDSFIEKAGDNPVNVLIESIGGSTLHGIEIANAFRRHGNVTVTLMGYVASAATIAAMGAKYITIDSNALFLIHNCRQELFNWMMATSQDYEVLIEQLKKEKSELDIIDLNIANIYAKKCGKDIKDVIELMKKDTLLSSDEAKAWGFVDSVSDLGKAYKPIEDKIYRSLLSYAGLPTPPSKKMKNHNADDSIINKIKSLFNPQNNNEKMSLENLPLISAIAGKLESDIEILSAVEKNLSEKNEKIDSLEKELKTKLAEIESLNKKIQEMQETPAEETKKVTVEKQESNQKSFADVYNSANKLLNSI